MLLKMLFRNVFRHKLRTALTVCGIGVAILAFGAPEYFSLYVFGLCAVSALAGKSLVKALKHKNAQRWFRPSSKPCR